MLLAQGYRPFSQSVRLYTVWNIFKPTILGASWTCKENKLKNKCIVKKALFSKNVIRESSAIKYALTYAAYICHYW